MGLFNSFLSKTQKKPVKINVNWINLTSIDDINQIWHVKIWNISHLVMSYQNFGFIKRGIVPTIIQFLNFGS